MRDLIISAFSLNKGERRMILKKEKNSPRDMYLMEKIQPSGGITFKDVRYITTGSGYEGCIHIYQFPEDIDTF